MAYAQITLSTLRSRLQDRYDATPFWSNEEARLAINEALRVWNAMTGYWKARSTASTTAGVPWVTVPGSAITFSTRVERSSTPLFKVSLFELDMAKPGWQAQTTTTGGAVPTSIKFWAPAGLKKIAIWPIDAAGSTTLTFDGVALTPTLSADGDYIDIGQEELNTILGYAVHILCFKRGGEQFLKTKPMYDEFVKVAATRNALLGAAEPFKSILGGDFTRSADSPFNDHRGYK